MNKTYIRVECVENETGESCGGYMCAIMMLFGLMLNVSPDIDMDEFSEMLDKTKNPEVQSLLPAFVSLGDIPKPDIYEADKNNHVCLYTEDEFYEAIYDLSYIAELLMDILNCQYSLEYKPFTIDEEDIFMMTDIRLLFPRKHTMLEKKIMSI